MQLHSPTRWATLSLFDLVLCGLFVTGWGVHEHWQNRCTVAAYAITTFPIGGRAQKIWIGTLHIATELISAEIDAIIAALERELKTKRLDTTEEQWEATVVELVRGLIRDLETLSDGWANGALAITLSNAFVACSCVCGALSPTFVPWVVEQSGVGWLDKFLKVFFASWARIGCRWSSLFTLNASRSSAV